MNDHESGHTSSVTAKILCGRDGRPGSRLMQRAVQPGAAALAAGLFLILQLAAGVLPAQTTDAEQEPQGLMRWFNPSTAPFIPVPDIDVDPNSGTTLGLIP